MVLEARSLSRSVLRQAFGKPCKAIQQLPFMREGSTKPGFRGGIVLQHQRRCEQRSSHSEVDCSDDFEAIYTVLGKERPVTNFWREHTSDLQRQIHPSTSMAVPVSIGEH
jgi:hypothetical protein